MTTLFISDLHLDAAHPEIGRQFLTFLNDEASNAEALYILGDLFESWVGDDDPNPHYADMKQALRKLVDKGVPVYFMHGNRDFLIGQDFARETGVQLLSDPCVAEFYGDSVLLSHGDALCTDDVDYQKIRQMTRNSGWQAMVLAKPLAERMTIAANARAESKIHGQSIDLSISDVAADAVNAVLQEYGTDILLHGHTHRPGVHELDLGDRRARRIVLGDWYDQGSVVRWDEMGPVLSALARD